MSKTLVTEQVFTCKYCKKTFKRESTLTAHACEKKRRYQQKDEKGVRIGFQAYLRFYEYTQNHTKQKSVFDFIDSPYYTAFVRFGRYCIDINAVNIPRFIDYVITNNKKLDYWAKDSLYEEYLNNLLLTEDGTYALQRAIEYSIKWAKENNADSKDILRYGNPNTVCHAITTGKISAWVLYNCDSGNKFLENLNTEQAELIWDYINPDVWQSKIQSSKDDVDYIQSMLQQAGW